jgi:hypothetical protein
MEVSFDEEGVSIQLPSGTVRLEGGWTRLKLPHWEAELWGDPRDLAKLANLIITGGLREEDVNLLKTVSEFSHGRQTALVNMFVSGRYDTLKSFIETTRTYDEFERRGFHYFEGSHQLLLVTGTLITFLENGGIKVGYADTEIEKFNEWLQKGSVEAKEYGCTLLKRDGEILEAAEKHLPQHAEAIRTLRLVSEFSRIKQARILKQMEGGRLSEAQVSKYRRDLEERKASREKRREYRMVARKFWCEHMYLHKDKQELLIETSYPLIFVLVKFGTLDGCKVFEVEIERIKRDRRLYPDLDQIIGQWVKTGRISKSRYVSVKELKREDMLSPLYYEALVEAMGKLEEPYQSQLQSLLVFSKLLAPRYEGDSL